MNFLDLLLLPLTTSFYCQKTGNHDITQPQFQQYKNNNKNIFISRWYDHEIQ